MNKTLAKYRRCFYDRIMSKFYAESLKRENSLKQYNQILNVCLLTGKLHHLTIKYMTIAPYHFVSCTVQNASCLHKFLKRSVCEKYSYQMTGCVGCDTDTRDVFVYKFY